MVQVTCSECSQQADVPFQPTAGKPVYCDACFKKRRASTGPRGPGGPGGRGRGGPRFNTADSPGRKKFSRSDYPGSERFKTA